MLHRHHAVTRPRASPGQPLPAASWQMQNRRAAEQCGPAGNTQQREGTCRPKDGRLRPGWPPLLPRGWFLVLCFGLSRQNWRQSIRVVRTRKSGAEEAHHTNRNPTATTRTCTRRASSSSHPEPSPRLQRKRQFASLGGSVIPRILCEDGMRKHRGRRREGQKLV